MVPGGGLSWEEEAAATARPPIASQGGRADKNGEVEIAGAESEAMGHAGGAVVGAT